MIDTQTTRAAFVTDGEEVTAVFPDQPWDNYGRFLTCYAHIGQHGACAPQWAREQRDATQEERSALQAELHRIGYRIEAVTLAQL